MNKPNSRNSRNKKYPKIIDRQLIAEVPKTEATSLCANIVTNEDGEKFLDIRNWYTTQYDSTPRPSSGNGIFVPLEQAVPLLQQIQESKEYQTLREDKNHDE